MTGSEVPDWVRRARTKWRWDGSERPPFAASVGTGQESVWDYPRPPQVDAEARRVIVRCGDTLLADTRCALRLLETASPPTFYLSPTDVATDALVPAAGDSFCEWKGAAQYWSVAAPGVQLAACGWSYPEPFPEFASLRGYFSFYPALVECFVDGVRVEAQPGRFYGGWVTPELVGPFKGEPGSEGW